MNKTCKKCGAKCCKTLIVPCAGDAREFMLATRGIAIAGGVMIESRCRHLGNDDRCMIYENRPSACRNYVVGSFACVVTQNVSISGADPSDRKTTGGTTDGDTKTD